MSPISDHRSAPPPDGLRDLHHRLSCVLADLTFPAQRWQLIATADLYGCDTVTRGILERAPEQRYHTLPEVVTVLGAVLGGRPLTPVPSPRPAPAVRPVRPAAPVVHGRRGGAVSPPPAA